MKGGHARRPGAWAILVALVAALFLLALFSPASEPENHGLIFDCRPAAEILILLGLLAIPALVGRRLPWPLRGLLALLLVAVALVNFVDAVLPGLFGRRLDLYWDVRHVPSLLGLLYDSAGTWRAGLVTAAATGALVAAFCLCWLALRLVERAATQRSVGLVLLALGIIGVSALTLPGARRIAPVSTQLSGEIAEQGFLFWRAWQVAHGHLGRYAAALAAPQRQSADLAKLKHRDVFLVFFESYGTVVLDNPQYRAAVMPALRRFEAKVGAAGYHLLSDRILSPTFGGGSWLAHGTMASGVKLDPFLSRLLVESHRKSLPRYMEAAGYRTLDVMPGIKNPWPEGRFWGFDAHDYGRDLGYHGLAFGWFGIPDQYTLKKLVALEPRAGGKPLFAQIVLVSSHTPFVPVPPYVADWQDAGAYKTVSQKTWHEVYRQPDWQHLEKPYLEAVAYDLDVLGDWLASRVPEDALVIILGDHQPPAFISGSGQPWTVPIYALSRDPDLVAPFAARGYLPGAIPEQKAPWLTMASFLPDFLDDFSTPEQQRANSAGTTQAGR